MFRRSHIRKEAPGTSASSAEVTGHKQKLLGYLGKAKARAKAKTNAGKNKSKADTVPLLANVGVAQALHRTITLSLNVPGLRHFHQAGRGTPPLPCGERRHFVEASELPPSLCDEGELRRSCLQLENGSPCLEIHRDDEPERHLLTDCGAK